jgi:DEAD/DEAH box helicase domain-containing protein
VTASPVADPVALLDQLVRGREPATHVVTTPARPGVVAPWPPWVPAALVAAFTRAEVRQPWSHQAAAAELVYGGTHTVVATGTGSGKSLAYQLPVLSRLLGDPRSTALYLAPTKALAADQYRALSGLDLPSIAAAVLDGDTPMAARDWVRAHAQLILTNPDMLHHSVLPRHASWATFLRRLRFVVIDECHGYRGIFGSHVAQVIRRLRRLCLRYGSAPVFILASATSGSPAESATALVGAPVTAVTEDGSPHGAVTFALWEPPLLPARGDGPREGMVVRKSALSETADLLADMVAAGARTLAFIRSRRGTEVVAAAARRALADAVPELVNRVAAYRGGYLREERRDLEQRLHRGDLLALATTNALELGVDLVGLDAVLMCGYPGTLASVWQQAGRAGRAGRDALCVLIARDDPLDTYLVHHPEALFSRPVEAAVLDPLNPYVLAPHLCCAATEQPLSAADLELFGGQGAVAAADAMVAAGALRRRPTGYYWIGQGRPDVDLRGGGGVVSVVETATGRLLGTVDHASSHHLVHPGAVYVHQGSCFVVEHLDLDDGVAMVRPDDPSYSTHARESLDLEVVSVSEYIDAGPVGLFLGTVDVTSQIVSYQRRQLPGGEVIDTWPLDLPPRQLRTTAVWYTISARCLEDAGVEPATVPGALHAAEHAAIGLLPLVATCDRWDIGGLSTAVHPDTGAPTVFVYDGHQGGAGFAERAYRMVSQWLTATRDLVAVCPCDRGCPSCVQSPKCGNGNEPLAKDKAVLVLDAVRAALSSGGPRP